MGYEQTPWVRYLDMGLKADPALQSVLIGRGRDEANGQASSQRVHWRVGPVWA